MGHLSSTATEVEIPTRTELGKIMKDATYIYTLFFQGIPFHTFKFKFKLFIHIPTNVPSIFYSTRTSDPMSFQKFKPLQGLLVINFKNHHYLVAMLVIGQ